MNTPLLPAHALAFFGPTPAGDWGGVPWDQGKIVPTVGMGLAQRPWRNSLAVFAGAKALILSGSVDDDTDGPGGGKEIDPCWQGETSLKWPDGRSIDSRAFRGLVMHRVAQARGGGLGDLGLCCWRGTIHAGQYYDIGPAKKVQEASEKMLRDMGVIEPGQSSRHAAVVGNDVTDFCSLIFLGSAPKDAHGRPYAVEQAAMIRLTLDLWRAFTKRPPQ